MAQDWWTARRAQKQADKALWALHRQQLYLPLLAAGRESKTRLAELAAVYAGQSPGPFTPTAPSRDFRELHLLSPEEIPEQQESIAEMMVDSAGRVLSHYDFRRRLLELPGWEQFTALFLFFISEDDRLDGQEARARFVAKVPHEVQATTRALARLETRLSEICGRSSGGQSHALGSQGAAVSS